MDKCTESQAFGIIKRKARRHSTWKVSNRATNIAKELIVANSELGSCKSKRCCTKVGIFQQTPNARFLTHPCNHATQMQIVSTNMNPEGRCVEVTMAPPHLVSKVMNVPASPNPHQSLRSYHFSSSLGRVSPSSSSWVSRPLKRKLSSSHLLTRHSLVCLVLRHH